MGVDKTSFTQYTETRGTSGYGSAWLYKDLKLGKYCMISATESVPYVFGGKDTFDFDLLQAPTKGQIEGKPSLEAQDIEVLHHRDNAFRFSKLKGQTLDFMTINSEFVGYKFSGTVDYRPSSAGADVSRATVTITPMSADATPVYNARPFIVETLCFNSGIPETVKVGEEFDISVKQADKATIAYEVNLINEDNSETLQSTTTDYDFSNEQQAVIKKGGLFAITVKDTAENYAPWTTTVYVEA